MALTIHRPQGALADSIEMLWCYEGYHPAHPAERILPIGHMEIVISLTDVPFRLRYADGMTRHIAHALVSGGQSQPYLTDTSQSMMLLAVLFRPGAALPFFGAGGHELHNQHLSLEDLWGLAASDLYCRLLEAGTVQARFQILEQALCERLVRAKARHRAVGYALAAFRTAPGNVAVRQVADDIALSHARFIQVFREDTGMTPKQYVRVQRFQRAMHMLAANSSVEQTDVALACGYYDQSHFINDFRKFAGITPTEYAPWSRDHNANVPVFEKV
ncbi:MAG: helix-turn-helix domain-containing protein [Chloroflexota bacterium]